MANEITVRVKAEDSATATFQKVGKEAQGLGKVFSDVGKIAGGFLAANVVAGAGAAISGFVGQSIKAASDLGESLNAVNKIFGDSAKVILDWGDKQANAYGLSQRAFNQLAVPLGAGLRNAGLASDVVAEKTIELTKRASDMASVFNTDVSEALEAIQSGLRGEADPLERFGVGLSAAKVEAHALAMTGKDVASSLTEQEKMLARIDLLMQQTASTQGDFAATSGEVANAARIQQAKMEELQATIGQKLLPVQLAITKAKLAMVDAIATQVLPALDNFIKYIKFVVEEGDTMNDFLANLPEPVQGVAKAFGETALFIKEHWDTIMAVTNFAIDYVRTRIEGFIQVVGAIVEIVSSTVNLVSDIFHGRWSEAWGEMKDIASAMIDLFIGYIKATFGNLPEIMYNAGRDAGNALVRGLKDAAGSVLDSVSVGGISAKDALDFGGGLFRAAGGPVSAGQPYVVGERGPELFVPGQSGGIVPNHMLGGSSARTVVNVNVYNAGSVLSERDLVQVVRDAILGGALRGVVVTP